MSNNQISPGEIVTVDFGNLISSNTFIVEDVLEDDFYLLKHPLFEGILIKKHSSYLNKIPARLKDSSERSLDFARRNYTYLGYKELADLEALSLFFVVRRLLTDNQKNILSRINGTIASIKFNNDIDVAMKFITDNQGMLDEFNKMWYNNFKNIFSKKQPISSKKQRSTIFNMAGFILAELENPWVEK